MRKSLSISALLSSLLATPLLGATPPQRPEDGSIVLVPQADTPAEVAAAAQLPGAFSGQLELLINGQPLSTYGMQELNERIAADLQVRLQRLLAEQRGLGPMQVQVQRIGQQRLEKGSYLGITTTTVSGVLRDQLGIPRGMGLVVTYVESDSPAAAAGLRVNDILQKLEDQWLINPQQLAVLVRSKRPGESISLTVLRGGKEQALTAQLTEKDLPLLESLSEPGALGWVVPAPAAGASARLMQDFEIRPRAATTSVRVEVDGTERRTLVDDQHDITILKGKDGVERISIKDRTGRNVYEGDGQGLPPDAMGKVNELRLKKSKVTLERDEVSENAKSVTLTRVDADHQITLRADERGRSLSVKDVRTGQMLFEGPFRGEEELKALPGPVLEKVKVLNAKAAITGGGETPVPGL
jgi:hypothetical protein